MIDIVKDMNVWLYLYIPNMPQHKCIYGIVRWRVKWSVKAGVYNGMCYNLLNLNQPQEEEEIQHFSRKEK